MGNIDTGAGAGRGRRTLDSEINMIPMIDLLMVTISFLLITAVWTHMARIEADAKVPGPPSVETTDDPPETRLHVKMRAESPFLLEWKAGNAVVDSAEVPRSFPELAARIEAEWKSKGHHAAPSDARFDEAVLHTDDATAFKDMVAAMDAIHRTHRDLRVGSRTVAVPAFSIRFAAAD